jgi:hypothetical protein
MLEEKPDKLSLKLSQYIAAQSRKKIARQFRNQNLSQPYYDSLKRVEDIPLLPSDRKKATDHRPGAARLDMDEYDSDRRFLKNFLGPYNDKKSTIPLGIPIEHLLKKVDESETVSGDIELYTNDTCTEFHHLLLLLLSRFEVALNRLVPVKNSDSGPEPSVFKNSVEQLQYYAYPLLRLARGRAFRMHLENIEHLLDDPRLPSAGASTDDHNEEHDNAQQEEDFDGVLPPQRFDDPHCPSAGASTDNHNEEHDNAQQDEDFDGVLPPQKLKSYVAWLRLIVGHFDAIEILVRFVKSSSFPYQSISIQILDPPPTSGEKLDWQKLFTDGPLPDVAVYKFLCKGVMAVKDRNAKEKRKKTDEDPEIDALRRKLVQHPSAYQFFISLARNKPFKGALHCEAHLASVLHVSTGDTKEIEIWPELKVKYISCHLSGPHFLFL